MFQEDLLGPGCGEIALSEIVPLQKVSERIKSERVRAKVRPIHLLALA